MTKQTRQFFWWVTKPFESKRFLTLLAVAMVAMFGLITYQALNTSARVSSDATGTIAQLHKTIQAQSEQIAENSTAIGAQRDAIISLTAQIDQAGLHAVTDGSVGATVSPRPGATSTTGPTTTTTTIQGRTSSSQPAGQPAANQPAHQTPSTTTPPSPQQTPTTQPAPQPSPIPAPVPPLTVPTIPCLGVCPK